MRHAPARAQARLLQYGVQQLIGMQAAFHENVHFALRGQLCGFLGGCMTVRHINQFYCSNVQTSLLGDCANFVSGANQHGNDQPMRRRIQRTSQGFGIARVHHGTAQSLESLGFLQQGLQPCLRIKQLNQGCLDFGAPHLLGRRDHHCLTLDHILAMLVDHGAVERDPMLFVLLGEHCHAHVQGIAHPHWLQKLQVLFQINRTQAWKLRPQHR